jgi:hypothetical protein
MPLPADIWTIVTEHVLCTKTLLRLRVVNRRLKNHITMPLVTGVPSEMEGLLWSPVSVSYGALQVSAHEDIEGSVEENGKHFWAWVYSDPMRLIEYDMNQPGSRVTMLKMPKAIDSFLWIKVAPNGLICTLATADEFSSRTPLILSVMRRNGSSELLENVMSTEISQRLVMYSSAVSDDPQFSRNRIQCFVWKTRTFIIMMPLDQQV